MKLLGENSARLELLRKSSSSALLEFRFSCEWCSGSFEFFSEEDSYRDLKRLCVSISGGKREATWLSEEGDLELNFSTQSTGRVKTYVVCNPSVQLEFPGKLEFEIELDLASFDQVNSE